MVGALGDGVVFRCRAPGPGAAEQSGPSIDADYFEEMTPAHFNSRFSGLPRLFWAFGYGEQRRGLHKSREEGTLFQVSRHS